MALADLTNELFERVVISLEFQDIKSLRLVNKTTAHKATQDAFKSFFRQKYVDLTKAGLCGFVNLTANGGLGCLVEDLTLVGIVYNPLALENVVRTGVKYVRPDPSSGSTDLIRNPCGEVELHQAAKDLETLKKWRKEDDEFREQGSKTTLLKAAFANVAACKKRGGLRSLSLEISVYRDDAITRISPRIAQCWKWVSEAAAETFSVTMAGLRDSGLRIDTMNVFARKPESLSCNVPPDVLHHFDFGASDFAPSLTALKTLSIGISDLIVNETERDVHDVGDPNQQLPFGLSNKKLDLPPLIARMSDDSNYSGLSAMIQASRNLEDLDISGYQISLSNQDLSNLQDEMRRRYMYHLARITPLPKLRKLRLAGLETEHHDLLSFLTAHSGSLCSLELNNISIAKGSWSSILSIVTSMTLEIIHLEDLWERDELIEFTGKQEQLCTRISGDYAGRGVEGRNVIRRWGPDARMKIPCRRHRGRAIGSGKVWNWTLRRTEEFGGR